MTAQQNVACLLLAVDSTVDAGALDQDGLEMRTRLLDFLHEAAANDVISTKPRRRDLPQRL
jgi:hypothetical protein